MSKLNEALNIVARNKSHARYFFQQLTRLDLFYDLKERNFFNPDNIEFIENNAQSWPVLNYFEKVAKQIENIMDIKEKDYYAKELINIIKNTVDFSRNPNQKKINNPYIWWSYIKILANISEYIKTNIKPNEFQLWIQEFCDNDFDRDFCCADIISKLLPKLLTEENKEYAKIVIDLITQIKPSEGKVHAFSDSKEAVLLNSSYWLFNGFNNLCEKIAEVCGAKIVLNLLDKLRRSLEYHHISSHRVFNIGEDYYKIIISREFENEEILIFKKGFFTGEIKQFSKKQLKGINLENNYDIYRTEPEILIKNFNIENAFDKKNFIQELVSKLPSNINWEKDNDYDKQIDGLYNGFYEDYSSIWIRSIEHPRDYMGTGAHEKLPILIKDVLLEVCKKNKEQTKCIIEKLLLPEYNFSLFIRVILLIINKTWSKYKKYFEDILEKRQYIFKESSYEVELFDLLKKNSNTFDNCLCEKIKKIIDDVPSYYVENGEEYIAHWYYKWLSALKDNSYFSKQYIEYKNKAKLQEDRSYEPDRGGDRCGWVKPKSPISKDEMLKMKCVELVDAFNNFTEEDRRKSTDPLIEIGERGFGEAFQKAILEQSNKFLEEINIFKNAPYWSITYMFMGFQGLLNNNKKLDLNKIFDFCKDYIKTESFLNGYQEAKSKNKDKAVYIVCINSVLNFLEIICQKDEISLNEADFDKIDNLFDLFYSLVDADNENNINREAINYALNTTYGTLVRCYIFFSLRKARFYKKPDNNWGKEKYEKFFEKGIEAYIWFGRFLINVRYLNKVWVDKKIEEFEKLDYKDSSWKFFIESYLSGNQISKELYVKMKGNCQKCIDNKILSDAIDKRLVDYICIGYFNDNESLTDYSSQLYRMLIDASIEDKHHRWIEIVNFLWSFTGKTLEKKSKDKENKENYDDKIIEFWRWAYNKRSEIKKILNKDYEEFLGHLLRLMIILPKIEGEYYDWIKLSLPYMNENRNMFFIEYLTKFEDKESIKNIADIYMQILNNGITPTYKKEDIEFIIKRIYDHNCKNEANDICDTYARRGMHFLRPLWEKYNK